MGKKKKNNNNTIEKPEIKIEDMFKRREPEGYKFDPDNPRIIYVEKVGEECPICHEKLWFKIDGVMKCTGCFTFIKPYGLKWMA